MRYLQFRRTLYSLTGKWVLILQSLYKVYDNQSNSWKINLLFIVLSFLKFINNSSQQCHISRTLEMRPHLPREICSNLRISGYVTLFIQVIIPLDYQLNCWNNSKVPPISEKRIYFSVKFTESFTNNERLLLRNITINFSTDTKNHYFRLFQQFERPLRPHPQLVRSSSMLRSINIFQKLE
jgi:hypothetical protein